MNLFTRFFGFFSAMFAGLFSGTAYKDRLTNRMAEHNQGAYNSMREKLSPYAKKFLLPLQERDDDGILRHTKKSKAHAANVKGATDRFKLLRGCREFLRDGHPIIALNQKNADRKFAAYEKSLALA